MNVEKLLKLKAYILAEPRRYNQAFWMYNKEATLTKKQNPPCGTVACLAGNACLMEGWTAWRFTPSGAVYEVQSPDGGKWNESIRAAAQDILELDDDQADGLFDGEADGWSDEARRAYEAAVDPHGRARAAAMEIDALIAREDNHR